jgi:dTDP-4-amino-4,6-dideoxygalactose transaminase
MNIPFFALDRQYAQVGAECLDHTDRVLRSGQFIDGDYSQQLEGWLKDRTGANCVVLVHSGTQALELLAQVLHTNDVRKPRVLIPNITFVATANAFIKAGYNIMLGDVDDRGIMLPYDRQEQGFYMSCGVGLYGANPHPAVDAIDGAQSWLTGYMNTDFMTVSFDPTKNLSATGNGGAILINDYLTAANLRKLRDNNKGTRFQLDFGQSPTNSKMSEIDCAHVLVRTKYIDEWQSKRRQIAEYWNEQFKYLPLRSLIELTTVSGNVNPHQIQKYVIRTTNTEQREQLQKYLKDRGIETRIHYEKCLSELPVYEGYVTVNSGVANSIRFASEVLSLPVYPELSDTEVEHIAHSVKAFYDR